MRHLLLLIALFTSLAFGHEMNQVKAQMEVGKNHWSAIMEIECWALYPSEGPHLPDESVEENFAGVDWLNQLDRSEWEGMKETAKGYLRDCFKLTLNDKPLPFEVEFLDFANDPPKWKVTDKGHSVYQIRLHGTWGAGEEGPLQLLWLDYSDEALSLQVESTNQSGESQLSVMRIETKELTKLADISASGEVGEAAGTSLLAWIWEGFIHIIPKGLDHILFILGLFFLQPRVRPLLWQSSAFTIAHSITLGLVITGLVSVSSKIVEPSIAISVAYVGFENLWLKQLKAWRVGLIFGLGLLHGLGFASAMTGLSIPSGSLMTPLLGFNVGVECAQVTVLIIAFALTGYFINKPVFAKVRVVASVLIGLLGLYMAIERLFS